MRGVSLAGIAVGLGVFLVACGGGSDVSSKATETNMPTEPQKASLQTIAPELTAGARARPTSVPTSTPLIPYPGMRSCKAADIEATYLYNNNGTQFPVMYIRIGNRSPYSCQVLRPPALEFIGADGQVLPVSVGQNLAGIDSVYLRPIVLLAGVLPGPDASDIRTGEVLLLLGWSTVDCRTPSIEVASVDLVLSDGAGRVTIDMKSRTIGLCKNGVSMSYQPVR